MGRCHYSSGDDNRSVHPGVVGARVLVRSGDCEGHCVGGVLIHVLGIKAELVKLGFPDDHIEIF